MMCIYPSPGRLEASNSMVSDLPRLNPSCMASCRTFLKFKSTSDYFPYRLTRIEALLQNHSVQPRDLKVGIPVSFLILGSRAEWGGKTMPIVEGFSGAEDDSGETDVRGLWKMVEWIGTGGIVYVLV